MSAIHGNVAATLERGGWDPTGPQSLTLALEAADPSGAAAVEMLMLIRDSGWTGPDLTVWESAPGRTVDGVVRALRAVP